MCYTRVRLSILLSFSDLGQTSSISSLHNHSVSFNPKFTFFTHATLRVQNIFPIALDSLRFLFSFPNNLQPHLSYLSSQLPYASLLLFFSSPLPLPTSCTPPSFFLNLTDRIQKHICIQRNIRKRLNENFEGIIFFSANISHRKHLNNPQ